MRFIQSLLTLSLVAAPAFAAPITESDNPISSTDETKPTKVLSPRAPFVTCTPKKNETKTKFIVDVAVAEREMKEAGLVTDKSGDPHHYGNFDGFHWGVHECDDKKHQLWEFPIFWVGSKHRWQKNQKTFMQAEKTPIRVVYADVNNTPHYCGIMIHETVKSNYQGTDHFEKCE
ncbi:hypothetical protein ASPWEDRAFT_182620 [Aspergillus wentii DTO 134E9]|uniref:Uncharacterized protein n=1 Tax=Aspergillus wentii DTO 134E9 TaxID=1073089 RepID=A0A1L9RS85_ASPWE|nr:uncharacterized protein ASPWEDRAFT_182620 [Aspergillus wentii DTO 134E9]KAI9930628.1 hypothetical protein MW887_011383 [Aspergillus wentii]OJJ37790.1 hypothetical protein ASPWEDRAFT_182620 [Aspergillus wentii DTO 134E9]